MYDWDRYEQLIRRLYLEEGRSLEEVSDFLRCHHNFLPGSVCPRQNQLPVQMYRLQGSAPLTRVPRKRTLQHKFRQWGFAAKRTISRDDERMVDIIRELWAKNVRQGEMLQRLTEDHGYEITDRDLSRIRRKNRLLIISNRRSGPKKAEQQQQQQQPVDRQAADNADATEDESYRTSSESSENETDGDQDHEILVQRTSEAQRSDRSDDRCRGTDVLGPAKLSAKRMIRRRLLEQKSAELWASRKRRRRTKFRGGLAPDPPQPPRFPSETTMEEAKIFLALEDMDLYSGVKDTFQRLCRENDVLKKTDAGKQVWEALKDQLIRECPHLQAQLWGDGASRDGIEMRKLSLDVICMAVTKTMRFKRMTVAEAKNILGLNPRVASTVRHEFREILRKDEFVSIVETGYEQWKVLRQQWIAGNQQLRAALEPNAHHTRDEKAKALNFLARDVAKRYKTQITRQNPSKIQAPKAFAHLHDERSPDTITLSERGQQLREAVKSPSALASALAKPPPVPSPSASTAVRSAAIKAPSTTIPIRTPQPEQRPSSKSPVNGSETRSQGQQVQQSQYAREHTPTLQAQQQQAPRIQLQTQQQTRPSATHSRLLSEQPSILGPDPDLSMESQLGLLAAPQSAAATYLPPSSQQHPPVHQPQPQILNLGMQPLPSLGAVSPSSLASIPQQQPQPRQQSQSTARDNHNAAPLYSPQPPTDIAVFIRQVESPGFENQMNIATLAAGAGVEAIRREAVNLSAVASPATCESVLGVVKSRNGGPELGIEIRSDDELGAYLVHMARERGGAPLFDVRMRWGLDGR